MKGLQLRELCEDQFGPLMVLYRELQPKDAILDNGADLDIFNQILASDDLYFFGAFIDRELVSSTYLNVIPNITRSASPYAIIENVITLQKLRGRGIGKSLMSYTLEFAWNQGCYKAMLQTGSKRASIHAFYRSCGFIADDKTAYIARPK